MVDLGRAELEVLKSSEKLPLAKLVKEVASLSREIDRENEEVASIHSVELVEANSQ